MITRRGAIALLGLTAGAATFSPLGSAQAQDISMLELGVAGPLGDIPLGSENAKVTIYEYSSLTCNHCADFHTETFPTLKQRYIDTGKVRYILREFPLDPLATGGAMLARCSGKDKYHAVISMLYEQQKNWAFTDKPLDNLRALMRQAGMSQQQFDACLSDPKILEGLNAVKNRASKEFRISSTPTFFINGKMLPGAQPIEEFEKLIKPALGE